MPIEVKWDSNFEHVLLWHFGAKWTWDDFHDAFTAEEEMVAEMGLIRHDGISTFTSSYIPSGNSIVTARNGLQKRNARPKFGLTILCTDRVFLVSTMNMLRRLNPEFSESFIAVNTFEEAYNLIRQSRSREQLSGTTSDHSS